MRLPAALAVCVVLSPTLYAQTTVTQTVTVTADAPAGGESIPFSYVTLNMDCVHHVNSNANPAESIATCKKVADEADKFDPKSHFITRRGAYVYYASALIRGEQYMDALAVAEKAVAVVLLGHDDASGSSSAYYIRGQAKAGARDFSGADRDLETAEAYQRKGLDWAAQKSPFLNGEYTKSLKGMLNFHAQILVAMGSQDAADLKLAEANKL